MRRGNAVTAPVGVWVLPRRGGSGFLISDRSTVAAAGCMVARAVTCCSAQDLQASCSLLS